MKNKSLITLSLLLGITSTSQAAWWDEELNNNYSYSNSQVYSKYDEDLALQMALEASMHDFHTARTVNLLDEVIDSAASRSKGMIQNNKVGVQTWLNNTFDEGANSAYALVRTQREINEKYSPLEVKKGSWTAQDQLIQDVNLSEDDLLDYVLQLSLLDR